MNPSGISGLPGLLPGKPYPVLVELNQSDPTNFRETTLASELTCRFGSSDLTGSMETKNCPPKLDWVKLETLGRGQ